MAYERIWTLRELAPSVFTITSDTETVTAFTLTMATPARVTAEKRVGVDRPTFTDYERIVRDLIAWFGLVAMLRKLPVGVATPHTFERSYKIGADGVHTASSDMRIGGLHLDIAWRSDTDTVSVGPRDAIDFSLADFREWLGCPRSLVDSVNIVRSYMTG